ncbi:hypothetical protein [Marinomonas sp. 2405UD68-3]|uniref:hypothetical protein n=1 Tax=Marinomonas sp. 2405UD68-3 TaxID=3391835 RepID=UPI0039C9D651
MIIIGNPDGSNIKSTPTPLLLTTSSDMASEIVSPTSLLLSFNEATARPNEI